MNILEFTKRFKDEESCRAYFKSYREQKGIVCPKCGCVHHYWKKNRSEWECKNCGHRTTLTSGTIMHTISSRRPRSLLCSLINQFLITVYTFHCPSPDTGASSLPHDANTLAPQTMMAAIIHRKFFFMFLLYLG